MLGLAPHPFCRDRVLSGQQIQDRHPLLQVAKRKVGYRTELFCSVCGLRVEQIPQIRVLRLSLTSPRRADGSFHVAALVWIRHASEGSVPGLFPTPESVQWISPPEVRGLHAPRWDQDGDVRRCDECGDIWKKLDPLSGGRKIWTQVSGFGHHLR